MKHLIASLTLTVAVALTRVLPHVARGRDHALSTRWRHTFPIARAVEVPAGYSLIFHSGLTPTPANPKSGRRHAGILGRHEDAGAAVFTRMKESLKSLGLGFGDVVKMTVFLVGDPANGGRMDFAGFMEAYTQYFGTKEQPNLPARSTVQVAGLARRACWSKSKCSWRGRRRNRSPRCR